MACRPVQRPAPSCHGQTLHRRGACVLGLEESLGGDGERIVRDAREEIVHRHRHLAPPLAEDERPLRHTCLHEPSRSAKVPARIDVRDLQLHAGHAARSGLKAAQETPDHPVCGRALR